MQEPTRSEKITLFLLCGALLLGMGISYYRTNHPFALEIVSPKETERQEALFEASKKISVTTGSEEDFAKLPHVGPQLAKRIVLYRDTHGFQKKEDLLHVKGIGAKTYKDLEELLDE